ncbi:ComEC/Rec2 family competence protein [Bdellovibrio sp. HCB290]|uniref:ComEC/Rec2 family competence protein n=1 Tax=Bdellovibrio sp. HCB290 TaxID=3394356 RepID=UPI0039B54E19
MGKVLIFSCISFLLILLSATPISQKNDRSYVIVWNVGQGQWVTAVEENTCRHFDVGGERFPWQKIAKLCRGKKNFIYLSHWDWDHIGALSRWPSSWDTCIALRPQGRSSPGKMKMLSNFADCKMPPQVSFWQAPEPSASIIDLEPLRNRKRNKPKRHRERKDSNGLSQVIRYRDFLFPGDSPLAAEMTWMNLPWVTSSRVLVLGHHGSRTSTSQELLARLPSVRIAIVSARYERYKHPHAEVVHRLRKNRIPVLRTEDWGNIWFER